MREPSRPGRAFALLCATFLLSPYGFDYDMGALAVVAVLLLTARGAMAGQAASAALALVAMLIGFAWMKKIITIEI